ncbi:hypothetical protein HDV06_001070 [Boothiomyces sp. JEL0866]|nr:hypothetical protein HDV06_001070 [Boothiomyces sp. JEL0866]
MTIEYPPQYNDVLPSYNDIYSTHQIFEIHKQSSHSFDVDIKEQNSTRILFYGQYRKGAITPNFVNPASYIGLRWSFLFHNDRKFGTVAATVEPHEPFKIKYNGKQINIQVCANKDYKWQYNGQDFVWKLESMENKFILKQSNYDIVIAEYACSLSSKIPGLVAVKDSRGILDLILFTAVLVNSKLDEHGPAAVLNIMV